jgi:alpha,alpha-trehalase
MGMDTSHVYDSQPLFDDVQMKRVFADGKTFVDCTPLFPIDVIVRKYLQQKELPGFNLENFILANFEKPVAPSGNYVSDNLRPVEDNIEALWPVLTRKPDTVNGSLIPLPYPYIVPGGRFGEIYYWDSYFTMLGLAASGKIEMLENMVKNFSFLIDTLGYIPNGNRSYFIGRSQPPFYSLMIKLLSTIKGNGVLADYLPQLEKEYIFWMRREEVIGEKNVAAFHTMKMKDGEIMNRYWDEHDTPRPESYREDVELSHEANQDPKVLFRHLRAGAESGWDYSCRWFEKKDSFATIHTTDIVPVDLNCLLFHLETVIADAFDVLQNNQGSKKYRLLAEIRKKAIQKYFWNEEQGFYFDYDSASGIQAQILSLAGLSPLFFNIASADQAKRVAAIVKEKFLQPGGVVSTLENTGQQWDAPNGWAPLQWMTISGLENYGHHELAAEIAKRWTRLNTDVFKRTGKLMEKYNVVDTHLEAGGGEYPGQDGFGWTNGVLLALIKKYGVGK